MYALNAPGSVYSACRASRLAHTCLLYTSLEQGLLTGKVTMDTTYPEGSTRNSNPSFQPARRAQALDMLCLLYTSPARPCRCRLGAGRC